LSDRRIPVPPRAVVFDADSTLVGIEGIDWLAAHRPSDVAGRIAALTTEAMAGVRPLEAVYGDRLAAVAPTRDEVAALGIAYVQAVARGAAALVSALIAKGIRPVIVSGGIHGALLPLAAHLGIPADDVHGVRVHFTSTGAYADFDRSSPLATQGGKAALVAQLALPRPIVAVGDGSTDLVIRTAGASDSFVAFTGFVAREAVVQGADFRADSFEALHALLLPLP
jgi:HAD superfamily phosphoserine phosphatase-like hydrolase